LWNTNGSFNSNFNDFFEIAETLTPYATEFRYPSEVLEPEQEEAKQAIVMAETIVEFVNNSLPPFPN